MDRLTTLLRDVKKLLSPEKRQGINIIQYLPSLMVLVIGLSASVYLFFTIKGWYWEQKASQTAILSEQYKRQISNFKHESEKRISGLRNQFRRSLEPLYSLRELFSTADHVSWEEFQSFASDPISRHSEIEGLFWIPRVNKHSRGDYFEALEAEVPATTLSGSPVDERQLSGDEPLWPIHYVSPPSQNRHWIGINTRDHSLFEHTLKRSLELDGPVSSYAFSSSGQYNRNHFFVFLSTETSGTLSFQHGSRVKYEGGFFGSEFNVNTIVDNALSAFDPRNIQLYVFTPDGTPLVQRSNSPRIINQFDDLEAFTSNLPSYREELQIGDINWTVVTVPSHTVPALSGNLTNLIREAWLTLIVGIAFSIATAVYLWTILREISKRRSAEKQLRRLARHDSLTNLLNRRTFFEELEEEFERQKRYGHDLSLLMLDIDHFKDVNDEHGHPKGDEVLKTVSNILQENAREPDVVGRYGGEEFTILLPETAVDEALNIAERIRKQVKNKTFQDRSGGDFSVTCSIGIAEKKPDIESPETLLDRSDQALYQAKNTGRDKTVLYG